MGKSKKKSKKSNVIKTRKDLRKEKRQQKKENKRNFFSKKNPKPGQLLKNSQVSEKHSSDSPATVDVNSEIESDFELSDDNMNAKFNKITKKPALTTAKQKQPTKKPAVVQQDRFLINQQKEKKKEQELQRKMRKRRIEQLKTANEDEDKIIRRLEKKLKINKHQNDKTVHKMFGDGLDYALELCLPESIDKMYKAAKDADESDSSDDGFTEDLAMAMGKDKEGKMLAKKATTAKAAEKEKHEASKIEKRIDRLSKAEAKYFKDSDLSGTDSEFGDDDDGADRQNINDSDDSDFDIVPSDEEDGSDQVEEDDPDGDGEETNSKSSNSGSEESALEDEIGSNVSKNEAEPNAKTWEDIYGRKRDQDGNLIEAKQSKYVPPHVRARLEDENVTDIKREEKLANLQRHCKGFLNRLSEANIQKIASDIENLYRSNSRFDMNNTLTKLVEEALISNVLTPERMVLEYAMLVAILHAHMGSEIGAHFLQTLITKIDKYINEIDSLDVENKEFDNTLFFLSHLYTFKIFQHSLIYELLTRLTEKLGEKSVECLLLVLRSVGFQLRKDDPFALKELIALVQRKASEAPVHLKENPRLKFMIDILLAIKNNNMTKIPQYDPSLAEHLKKIIKSIMINGKYITTLNITMEDLLDADEKGKWWVVGSAWTGNIKDIKAAAKKSTDKSQVEKFSDQLLMLAKQQRMNTEDRKNVFCIIMSAEDYVNAFERLLHLAIKDQRVIVAVIIHCCLSEKIFNPYYAALAQKFCEYDRKYQLAMQFALWDRIKELRQLVASKQESKNLAQLLINLITKGGQPLSVLKVIEFTEMDKVTLRFVRQIMLGLLLGVEDEFYPVFARIAPSAKLTVFKDSLRLFMHHFLLKGAEKTVESDKIELLKSRIRLADQALQSRDSKIKF